MMTARKVVTPALAMAGPRSTKAFFVFSNLEPVNKMSKKISFELLLLVDRTG